MFRAFQELDQVFFLYVPDPVFFIDKMIAGEKIAVMLDDRDIPAFRPEQAERMILAEGRPGCFLEYLDLDPTDILFDPFIKDAAKEIAPGFGCDRKRIDAIREVGPADDQRQEAHIGRPDLLE